MTLGAGVSEVEYDYFLVGRMHNQGYEEIKEGGRKKGQVYMSRNCRILGQ